MHFFTCWTTTVKTRKAAPVKIEASLQVLNLFWVHMGLLLGPDPDCSLPVSDLWYIGIYGRTEQTPHSAFQKKKRDIRILPKKMVSRPMTVERIVISLDAICLVVM